MLAYSLLFITVAAAKPPNVVFILADDMGQWAAGAYGNEEIITPNINRLASEGIRCDNAFCNTPVCSESRTSYFTGHLPSQHGVHDWINAATGKASLTHRKRLRTRMYWPRMDTCSDTCAELAGNITSEISRWPSTHLHTGLSTSRGVAVT